MALWLFTHRFLFISQEQVTKAFEILNADENVKAILVNIFGGIMKCDIIAGGIIAAAKKISLDKPLVVRLEGTNVAKGQELIAESGIEVVLADDLDDAAEKAVALVGIQKSNEYFMNMQVWTIYEEHQSLEIQKYCGNNSNVKKPPKKVLASHVVG